MKEEKYNEINRYNDLYPIKRDFISYYEFHLVMTDFFAYNKQFISLYCSTFIILLYLHLICFIILLYLYLFSLKQFVLSNKYSLANYPAITIISIFTD